MATLTHAESRRMYSWWWDSHISPKNSKWLQENLTDMDAKVKAMIKLIEEDADSFARRAEMYYKKRPELMKLVEEFYRAYRALAERYDHATGALCQAHRTMAEAFPNQVPFVLTDDSPSGSSALETEPHTPDMPHPMRTLLDLDDLHKDALGLSSSQFHALNRNGLHTDESDSLASRKGLKQLNDLLDSGEGPQDHAKFEEGRVRKGLNFHEDDGELKENLNRLRDGNGNSQLSNENNNLKARDTPGSVRAGNTDAKIRTLKEALTRLEAEKEASLLQYQQSLERLCNLETQVSHAQEDARGLNEHMRKAENEVQTLKQSLAKLEAEKEAAIQQYQQCLERICNLESKVSLAERDAGRLNEQASKAEAEVHNLEQALVRLEAEKDAILVQYKQCLEIISNMETKILHAEEDARGHMDRADRAESEIQSLKQAIAKLNEEKEASRVQYQHSVETISQLETKVSSTQEEIKRLNSEIALGVAKLNSAEQQYLLLDRDNQSLQKEVETLVQKIEMQKLELLEKQSELERLQTLLQEENLRSVKAEAALQALQELHSQSQEEQKALAVDLQKSVLMLKDMEHWSRGLEEEVHRVKHESKSLNEQNLSSAMSIKNMQDEIIRLKEMIMKLEQEVDLRLDQRNALQQEIYCLNEEINDLNRQHQGVIAQVESVGLNLNNLGTSVKELQEENVKLNEIHRKENDEKLALLRKLENMEKLLEKNALLENSLSDVNAELEGLREKVKELEESCHVLLSEKSTLSVERATIVSQLEIAAVNIEKLSEKNSLFENSLSDTNVELEGLKAKSKSLEESFQSLDKERAVLIDERETLVSHLKKFQLKLEELDKKYMELEDKYLGLEKEKEFTIHRVEEMQTYLDLEKQEHGSFVQSTEIRLARLEEQIHLLQEESRWRKKEYEDEQDRAIKAQVEISILHMCILDLEEKNLFLLTECQKYFEKSKLSEELICELKQESLEQQAETEFLLNQIENLKKGIQQVSRVLKIAPDSACQFQVEEDQQLIQHILQKIEDAESDLLQMQDEKQETLLEKLILVTLLQQLRLEAADLESETNILHCKFKTRTEELLMLKSEKQKLEEVKEQLQLEVKAREEREGILNEEIETLHAKLSDLQEAHISVKGESKKLQEENRSLMEELSELEQEKCILEEENNLVHGEVIALDHLSMVFKSFGAEKAMEVERIAENVDNLRGLNSVLEEEATKRREKLEMVEMENLELKQLVEKLESELKMGRSVTEQLNYELGLGMDMLGQKEIELLEVEQKLKASESENTELHRNIDDLKRDYDESKVEIEELEKHTFELSEINTHQTIDICCLHDANEKFESELANLHGEIGDRKIREENLSSALLETRNEVELQEAEATELYSELQLSAIFASLFEGKVFELFATCQRLGNETTLKSKEVELLKERLLALECENGGLKSELAACFPVIDSLRDSLTSLEDHVVSRTNTLIANNQETKDAALASQLQEKSCTEVAKVQSQMVAADAVSGWHRLQSTVKAVEKAVIEMERVAMQESYVTNIKLEAAMKEVEELKSKSSSIREEKLRDAPGNFNPQKAETEISNVRNGTVVKDIPLDQVSECSSYDHGISSQGKNRRENTQMDDQMLELWEATEQDCIVYHQINKADKMAPALTAEDPYHQIELVEEQRSEYPSSELQVEKELGVDKLEVSRTSKETRQANKKKTLERLASDAQKLINLQITVEDLKKKVAISNKSKKGKGTAEYDELKGQLERIEEAITQLVDTNGKLTKNVEGSPSLSHGKAVEEIDESGKVRRRRVTEQARRGSEKIGRLQLELQQIQFVLLKLEDESKIKGTITAKRSTKVFLRDYIYGGGRNGHRKKKTPCCACMRPTTKGE